MMISEESAEEKCFLHDFHKLKFRMFALLFQETESLSWIGRKVEPEAHIINVLG